MNPRPTFSFELAPPRNPDAAPKFWDAYRQMVAVNPDFMSITYGAGGTNRDSAREVVSRLVHGAATLTPVLPIAHLTCVGATQAQMREDIDGFLDVGTRVFLALRGDPPRDEPNWQPPADGVSSAIELIGLLREVEATRAATHAGAALRGAVHPLTIAVAAFPDGNPAAGTTRAQEVQRLLEKEQAGASFAITQLVYDAASYIDFVADSRAAGVTIPVLAGVIPVTDPKRLRTIEAISGIPAPEWLVTELEALETEEERHVRGLDISAAMAREILDSGAPGLHLYTFNQAGPSLCLLRRLDLLPGSSTP